MKILWTLFLGALFGSTLHAQGVITRIGSDGTKFYYNGVADLQAVFDDATGLSPNFRDTILFGGGAFLLTAELEITSPVVVIGSGIRPDSSAVYGGTTVIDHNGFQAPALVLRNGASGSELHGLTFSDGHAVRIGTSLADSDVDDVIFQRCSFDRLVLGAGLFQGQSLADGILIEQCVIRNELSAHRSTDVHVRNSFVRNIVDADANTNIELENCMILNFTGNNSNGYINYVNSIFLTNAATLNVTGNSSFTHCLFVGNGNLFAQNVTFSPSILTNVDPRYAPNLSTAFTNVTSYTDYQFNGNYTTTPTYSAAPYLGIDGLPRGIYGGAASWKDGSLPFNPHWSLLTTPANTSNGLLQGVHIKASAQEN